MQGLHAIRWVCLVDEFRLLFVIIVCLFLQVFLQGGEAAA